MSRPARGGAAQSGMTLVELLFLITLLSLASYSFTRFILSTRQATERQEAAGELLQRSLRILTNLRAGLQGCAALVANYGDGTGDAMLGLHNLVSAAVAASTSPSPGAPSPVTFTGWPTVETLSEVDMNGPSDSGAIVWGDEIMYVAELNPVTFTAYYSQSGSTWSVYGFNVSTTNTALSAEVLSVARLQFVYDYLSWDKGTSVAGSGEGLRLTEWRSQPIIDYTSLSDLTDTPSVYTGSNQCCPRLEAACQYLVEDGYSLAFAPGNMTLTANCGQCFYALTSEANIANGINTGLSSTLALSMSSWAYLDDFDVIQSYSVKPGVVLGRISRANGETGGQTGSPSSYSVAFNVSGTASTSTSVVQLQGAGSLLQVPAYATANYSMPSGLGGTGFPAGFEVAVDGQEGSREIFLRLVLMASNGGTTSPGAFQALQQTSEISVAPQSDF